MSEETKPAVHTIHVRPSWGQGMHACIDGDWEGHCCWGYGPNDAIGAVVQRFSSELGLEILHVPAVGAEESQRSTRRC